MNQEIYNQIRLISEIMLMYQKTVLKEKDPENLKLIMQDINSKQSELEKIKDQLEIELNSLYDNGANEIDPEINKMQIVINEVDGILEEIIPDIFYYLNLSSNNSDFNKKNIKKIEIIEIKDRPIFEKNETEFKSIINEKENVVCKIEPKKVKKSVIVENMKQKDTVLEKYEEGSLCIDNKEISSNSKKMELSISENNNKNDVSLAEEKELVQGSTKKNEIKEKNKDSFDNNKIMFEEISEDQLYMAPRKNLAQNKIQKTKNNTQQVEENNKNYNIKIKTQKSVEDYYTIKIKQPDENYRNVAIKVVSNRMKNIDSIENAIQKAYNAADKVMNNIKDTWKDNKN